MIFGCTIYKITNIINGKVYIGQTWRSIKDRAEGGKGYRNSKRFYAAIKKYGWQNFNTEVLTVCGTQETANYWEDWFITKFNSTSRNNGYNSRFGGSQGKLVEETKRKLSKAHKGMLVWNSDGRTHSEETKKKLSEARKGKSLSEETKRKVGDASRRRGQTENTGQKLSEQRKHKGKNVGFHKKSGKYAAYICIGGELGKPKQKHLGLFTTEQEALKVVEEYKSKLNQK